MAKFKGSVSTGYVGSNKEFQFEIDDEDLENMTEEEIEEVAFEEMIQTIDWTYWEI